MMGHHRSEKDGPCTNESTVILFLVRGPAIRNHFEGTFIIIYFFFTVKNSRIKRNQAKKKEMKNRYRKRCPLWSPSLSPFRLCRLAPIPVFFSPFDLAKPRWETRFRGPLKHIKHSACSELNRSLCTLLRFKQTLVLFRCDEHILRLTIATTPNRKQEKQSQFCQRENESESCRIENNWRRPIENIRLLPFLFFFVRGRISFSFRGEKMRLHHVSHKELRDPGSIHCVDVGPCCFVVTWRENSSHKRWKKKEKRNRYEGKQRDWIDLVSHRKKTRRCAAWWGGRHLFSECIHTHTVHFHGGWRTSWSLRLAASDNQVSTTRPCMHCVRCLTADDSHLFSCP